MNVYALRTDEIAILDTLEGFKKTYGRKYCFPSQKTILALLKRFHAITMSLRTLNRRLAKLEKLRLIRRIRRLSRRAFNSTVYYVCHKAAASGKVKKILGYGKRLAECFTRLPKVANNMITEKSSYGSGGFKAPPAPRGTEEKRCETSDQNEKTAFREGGAASGLMDWLRQKDKLRLLGKE